MCTKKCQGNFLSKPEDVGTYGRTIYQNKSQGNYELETVG